MCACVATSLLTAGRPSSRGAPECPRLSRERRDLISNELFKKNKKNLFLDAVKSTLAVLWSGGVYAKYNRRRA